MNLQSIARTAQRAETALGHGITYQLGKGGYFPKDSLPTRTKTCDCSGFVAWCLQLSRVPKLTRLWWLETTNIYRDAILGQKVFKKIDEPVKGCLVVFPDKVWVDDDGKVHRREGHVAVWLAKSGLADVVIDCSSSRGITKRTTLVFDRNGAIYCVLKEHA